MKDTVYVKKDGVVSERHSVKLVENKAQDKDCHLCMKCVNGYPSMCPKVADKYKKTIGDYDFITSGCQSFDDNGKSDILIVEKCNNYVPIKETTNTKKGKLAHYKKLKRNLAALYFDTETPEEAYLFQAELVERGHLKLNTNELLDPKTLEAMRKRVRK